MQASPKHEFILQHTVNFRGHLPWLGHGPYSRVKIEPCGDRFARGHRHDDLWPSNHQPVIAWVNWPTVCLLFGFFVISAQLRLSGFYDVVVAGIAARWGIRPGFYLF